MLSTNLQRQTRLFTLFMVRLSLRDIILKLILCHSGGGFIAFSAHPAGPLATIAHGIVKECKDLDGIFCIEYRLSEWDMEDHTTHLFPTALVDAIAGYNYLVNDVGYIPESIIIEGDSAGANLALALTRYLLENKLSNIPPPGGLVLVCPWTDLGFSHIKPGSSALLTRHGNFFRQFMNLVGINSQLIRRT